MQWPKIDEQEHLSHLSQSEGERISACCTYEMRVEGQQTKSGHVGSQLEKSKIEIKNQKLIHEKSPIWKNFTKN